MTDKSSYPFSLADGKNIASTDDDHSPTQRSWRGRSLLFIGLLALLVMFVGLSIIGFQLMGVAG
ncbi:hypothetical protein [Rhodoferax sp.]|uniref:hypothetical protein n=1 Tax=Rhodoferax sp. TaxID=50421 RepID=UPI00374DF52B